MNNYIIHTKEIRTIRGTYSLEAESEEDAIDKFNNYREFGGFNDMSEDETDFEILEFEINEN